MGRDCGPRRGVKWKRRRPHTNGHQNTCYETLAQINSNQFNCQCILVEGLNKNDRILRAEKTQSSFCHVISSRSAPIISFHHRAQWNNLVYISVCASSTPFLCVTNDSEKMWDNTILHHTTQNWVGIFGWRFLLFYTVSEFLTRSSLDWTTITSCPSLPRITNNWGSLCSSGQHYSPSTL